MNRDTWLNQAHGVLQKVEWKGHRYGRQCCPLCKSIRPQYNSHTRKSIAHAPDCRLAALLEELPE